MNRFLGTFRSGEDHTPMGRVNRYELTITKNTELQKLFFDSTNIYHPKYPKNYDEISLDPKQTWIRWDGSLVNEGVGESLFGNKEKNAQVFTRIGPLLVRRIYRDYSFKTPFGGYWFCGSWNIHIWRTVE